MTLMENEIKENFQSMLKTIDSVGEEIDKASDLINAASFVIITGSGTSFNAGHSLLISLVRNGTPAIEIRAPDFSSYMERPFNGKVTVVVLSQSGESKDALDAAKIGMESGATVIGVTNEEGSTLAHMSKVCLITAAGREKSVAATKSFTGQLTALLLLKGNIEHVNYTEKIKEIAEWSRRYTEDFSALDGTVKELREKIVILGDGYLYTIAMEAALKFRETGNMTTDAYNLREYLHGPIRTLDRDTTVITLGRNDGRHEEVLEAVRKYAGSIVEIGESTNSNIKVMSVEDCMKPLVYAVPIQMLACSKALSLGLNPDTPDKLTKVVR